ncbi:MAG TPA: DNA methyltransferase [Allosphingosinicella sp.]|nr:DNA methyltransferase [Allosphingosinicella sp.]
MRLSWNEIRTRAAAFARDWEGEGYEKGQTQLFYRDFLDVFGVPVRRVASFEAPVKNLGDKRGYIDLFWKGVLLVEQKSVGRDLKKAKTQALDYFPGLKDNELPRFILLSDFQNFELYDLEDSDEIAFPLADLPKHVEKFGFVIGVEKRSFKDQDPVNIEASELVGKLHDALEEAGYAGHDLEQFLVRIVYCLFADDTGIFEPRDIFLDLLENRTREDGSDLGGWLAQLFQVLNTPEDRRPKNLDADLDRFPYVNGDLFRDALLIPSFDSKMRKRLIDACQFDWSAISPAIFGSLFQSVMDKDERREQGAHYTSEKNILKVIEPLFMEDLWAEFRRLKARKDSRRRVELTAFHKRLSAMTFFDPACGCGNFLIIAYRELRLLEIELIRELRSYRSPDEQQELDAASLSLLDVDQFCGIEIAEFPARIAETALWMIDHIMNNRLSLEFGPSYVRIPLRKSPNIIADNALELNWHDVLPADRCSFLFGNPPFVGHQWRSKEQQADMARIWGSKGQFNRLDYVTCWFKKAKDYAAPNQKIGIAFVATNSITQGEQCGILWPFMLTSGLSIQFAHRTFQWNSEARGKAAVHCVIVGLTFQTSGKRRIFEYGHVRGEPHEAEVTRINGYLIDGPQYAVPARSQPQPGMLKMHKGSQPTDGARLKKPGGGYVTYSNLILEDADRRALLKAEPAAKKWLKPFVGGDELISGQWRWCLWLKDADPTELRGCKTITERLERVRSGRLQSPTPSVRAYAKFPTLFTQDRQPNTEYLAIPEVSSETREYIPMAVLPPKVIASNKLQIIPGADLIYFGILTSAMHMAWMRTVGGRLESRYSYAPAIYNSFPWPEMTPAQQTRIEEKAQDILDARASFPDATLETLYDPDAMPPVLRKAHLALDKAVDRLYSRTPFAFERERVEHLFELYEKAAAPLAPIAQMKKRRARRAKGP